MDFQETERLVSVLVASPIADIETGGVLAIVIAIGLGIWAIVSWFNNCDPSTSTLCSAVEGTGAAIKEAVQSAQLAPQAVGDALNPNSPTSAITQTTISSAFGAGFGLF